MPIVVTCPSCGSRFQAPDNLAGKRGKCPKCGTVLAVPGPAAAVPPALPLPAASDAALTTGERLHPCPDCGKLISRRAPQCPHCGCPVAEVAAAPNVPRSAFAPSAAAGASSRRLRIVLLGAGLVVVVLAVLVGVIVWKLSNAVTTLAAPLAAPLAPVVPAPAPSAPLATAEQKEAWISSVAQESARAVDGLYQRVHGAKTMIGQAQQASDLMQALAKTGDLSTLPGDTAPAPQPAAYQSQFEPLLQECLGYLRSHLPAGDFGAEQVRDVAAAWIKEKEAPVQRELERLLQQPTTLPGTEVPGAEAPVPPAAH